MLPRMTPSFLRLIRPLLVVGAVASGITLLNCSSDPEKAADTADSSTLDASSSADSSITTEDASDTGVADGAAPLTQAQLSTSCLDGNVNSFLHCYGDMTKAGILEYLPQDCEGRVAKVFLPGVSEAYRVALKACDDSRGSFCSGFSPACAALGSFFGTLVDGTACQESSQCSSGLCTGATDKVCGTCMQPLPTGGDCTGSNSKRCAMNAQCDKGFCSVSTLAEYGKECSLSRPCREGSTCLYANTDGGTYSECILDKTTSQLCPSGTVCASAGNNVCNGSCGPRPIEGGACDAKNGCRSGFVCDTGFCRKGKVDVAVGAVCKVNADVCVAGAVCAKYDSPSKSYSCVVRAKLDESCGSGVNKCAPPLVCDTATLLCRAASTLACP